MARLSLAFSGHMPDQPDRETPRFPPDRVPAAEKAIANEVRRQSAAFAQKNVRAFASLARGGDIIFHEACRAQGVRSTVVLPFNAQEFLETSVGEEDGWLRRFAAIQNATPQGDWVVLDHPASNAAYVACNEKILELAQAWGDARLIALWDGADGAQPQPGGADGAQPQPGGAGDFVRHVRALKIKTIIIDPSTL